MIKFCRFAGALFLLCQIPLVILMDTPSDSGSVDVQGNSDAVTGESDRVEPVFYVREDFNNSNKYLVIDDMIISRNRTDTFAGLFNTNWPNAIVPYNFALTILPQQRTMIMDALSEISSKTCIKFKPARNDDRYFLLYQNDPMSRGCWSYVGFQNERNQPVQISATCGKGNTIHETIHAVGFYHEQARDDRDKYVQIHYENIKEGREQNFMKTSERDIEGDETSYFGQPYNYESIMHYSAYASSKNDEPTIEVLDGSGAVGNTDKMGQRDYLTKEDYGMMNAKYCTGGQPVGGGPPQPEQGSGGGNPMCFFLPLCRR